LGYRDTYHDNSFECNPNRIAYDARGSRDIADIRETHSSIRLNDYKNARVQKPPRDLRNREMHEAAEREARRMSQSFSNRKAYPVSSASNERQSSFQRSMRKSNEAYRSSRREMDGRASSRSQHSRQGSQRDVGFDGRTSGRRSARDDGRLSTRNAQRGSRKRNNAARQNRIEPPFNDEIVTQGLTAREHISRIKTIILAIIVIIAAFALYWFVIKPLMGFGDFELKENNVAKVEFSPSYQALDGVPPSKSVELFSLTTNTPPVLIDKEKAAIDEAIAVIENAGCEIGFVMYNTKSGYGVSYNCDVKVYGASSIKGLYGTYIVIECLEKGVIDIDAQVTAKIVLDGSDGYVAGDSYSVRSLMQDMLVKSSNNAFVILRDNFDQYGWDDWVTSMDAKDLVRNPQYNFSFFTPRSASRIYTEMYNYLNNDETSDIKKQFKEWLNTSQMSFLRNAMKSKGATVMSKPGWNFDTDKSWNSIADSGIVNINGDDFICSFMSSLEYNEENQKVFQAVISAVSNVYDDLLSVKVAS